MQYSYQKRNNNKTKFSFALNIYYHFITDKTMVVNLMSFMFYT